MVAPKNIKLDLPEDIENVEISMMRFKTAESRIAYLKVMEKVTIKFYFSDDEETNSLKNHYVSVIEKNVEKFDEYLKKEREEYKPLGYKYDEEVIELELDLYDTIEEQIEYLKNKLIEFDIDTINVTTNEYDDLRRDIEIRIKNRNYILSQNKSERRVFGFDFTKIKKYAGELQEDERILYLKNILKEFDREKRENFYLFMSKEEIKYFEENIIITDPAKLNNPFDLKMVGIGAKRDLAKKNFEININNEIKFLQDKNNVSLNEVNEIDINNPQEFEKKLDEYLEYGKECYLTTWKDEFQLLTFEKKMIERYGLKVKGYIVHLYKYIAKKTNPIEFIGCDYDQQRKNADKEKLKNEIIRIDGYLTEIEKLAYLTDDDNGVNNMPEDDLENFGEWQCYHIEKINDKTLAEWINILRINRPGVWDYKYGEHYQIDFKAVTEFALKEFKNYRDRLENLHFNFDGKTKKQKIKISNEIISEEVIKCWDDGVEEFEEIYQKLSEDSENIFGIKLTKDQIKGRYQRYSSKHKDYKRIKY